MDIKITEEVREMYARICPTSTEKCESLSELDYKIQRMLDLGKKRTSKMRNLVIKYYHNEIVIKEGKIIRMFTSCKDASYIISEKKKTKHYYQHHKVLV